MNSNYIDGNAGYNNSDRDVVMAKQMQQFDLPKNGVTSMKKPTNIS